MATVAIAMDQRELESRVKALTKSVAANEPPETAIKLLDSLKKDAKPTEEMLRVSLNKLLASGPARNKHKCHAKYCWAGL